MYKSWVKMSVILNMCGRSIRAFLRFNVNAVATLTVSLTAALSPDLVP
jgi:hypothetical protein